MPCQAELSSCFKLLPLVLASFILCACAVSSEMSDFPQSPPMDVDDLTNQLDSTAWEEPEMEKRRLSVNNDLVSLAEMLSEGAARRKSDQSQSLLQRIGKRGSSGFYYFNPFRNLYGSSRYDFVRPRRGPSRLSVGLPLTTLTRMIQQKRQEMYRDNMESILRDIGKRSAAS